MKHLSETGRKWALMGALTLATVIGYGIGKSPRFVSISATSHGRVALDMEGLGGTYKILECRDLRTKQWQPACVALTPGGEASTNQTIQILSNGVVRVYVVPSTNAAFYGAGWATP